MKTFPMSTRNRLWSWGITLILFIAVFLIPLGFQKAYGDVECNRHTNTDRSWIKVWYDIPTPWDNKTKQLMVRVGVRYKYCVETIYVGGIPRKTDWVEPLRIRLYWEVTGGETIPCSNLVLGFNGLRFDPWIGSSEKQMLVGDQDWRVPCEGEVDQKSSRDHIFQTVRFYPPDWPTWNSTCKVNYNNRDDEDCNHIVNPGDKLKLWGVLNPLV